jgi:septal ring factor EnvC (AmiA/AmiB activator)
MKDMPMSRLNLLSSPRSWLIAGLFSSPVALGACVPKSQYEQLQSSYDAEAQARADSQRNLAALNDRYAALEAELKQVQAERETSQRELDSTMSRLNDSADKLAELQLEQSNTAREREEASERVEQLRDELSRIATHLATFAEARDQLSKERDDLKQRVEQLQDKASQLEAKALEVRHRFLLVRDLSVALHQPLDDKSLRLGVTTDAVALTTRTATLFAKRSTKLTPAGKRIVVAVAKVLKERNETLEIEELPAAGDPKVRLARLTSVAEVLAASGVKLERIAFDPPSERGEPSKDDGEQQIRLWIRDPAPTAMSAKDGPATASASAASASL